MTNKFEEIVECAKTGLFLKDNGEYRNFDTIDLLLMLKDTPDSLIEYIKKSGDRKALISIKKLIGGKIKGIKITNSTISYLKTIDYTVKGYTFTDEDKDYVINLLLKILPENTFNESIYFLGLRKFLNGDFDSFYENKSKSLAIK